MTNDLIERLEDDLHMMQRDGLASVLSTGQEAATALRSKDAEIAKLREALKPFADLAGEWDETGNTRKARTLSRFEDFHAADISVGDLLVIGDFRRARTALGGGDE